MWFSKNSSSSIERKTEGKRFCSSMAVRQNAICFSIYLNSLLPFCISTSRSQIANNTDSDRLSNFIFPLRFAEMYRIWNKMVAGATSWKAITLYTRCEKEKAIRRAHKLDGIKHERAHEITVIIRSSMTLRFNFFIRLLLPERFFSFDILRKWNSKSKIKIENQIANTYSTIFAAGAVLFS